MKLLTFFLRVAVRRALLEKFEAVGLFLRGWACQWVLKEVTASGPLVLKQSSEPWYHKHHSTSRSCYPDSRDTQHVCAQSVGPKRRPGPVPAAHKATMTLT